MAQLYSQYTSGTQLTAGTITGSTLGASGLNPIVDRLNSITEENGVLISGTVASDHGTPSTDMIVNVAYGTGATPPTASTTTEGALYIQYTP